MKVVITKKTDKPFKGEDGELVEYFWYSATTSDNLRLQFGSPNNKYEIGQEYEINIGKYEKANGKIGYKEFKD